jgi:signal transduction histidine kinase
VKELSLHILDIVQNSTKAGATEISIEVVESLRKNLLRMTVRDNGCGMSQEVLATIVNPFSTSRTTRKVGLGLSLLQAAAEQCNGTMSIESKEGKGTVVTATFEHNHIDRVPLGDMVSTLITLISGCPDIDFFLSLSNR